MRQSTLQQQRVQLYNELASVRSHLTVFVCVPTISDFKRFQIKTMKNCSNIIFDIVCFFFFFMANIRANRSFRYIFHCPCHFHYTIVYTFCGTEIILYSNISPSSGNTFFIIFSCSTEKKCSIISFHFLLMNMQYITFRTHVCLSMYVCIDERT